MKTIYKYEIPLRDIYIVRMPHHSVPVMAGIQHGDIYVWCEVDTEAETRLYEFFVVGTGHPLPYDVTYISTVFFNDFVFHVYYRE